MRKLTSLAVMAVLAQPALAHDSLNDYPTIARSDYVFACMASNGQTRDVLERCSCSIDVIASVLSYEDYVAAETVLRTIQVTGERVAAFRGSARHKAMVSNLRRAQAEADIICFGGG